MITTAFVFEGTTLSLLYAPVKYGTPLNCFLNKPLQTEANHNKSAYPEQYLTEPRKVLTPKLEEKKRKKQGIT